MNNLQNIQEKYFLEIKNILNDLSKIENQIQLLAKNELLNELNDKVSFLKILEQNKERFVEILPLQVTDKQTSSTENLTKNTSDNIEEAEKKFTEKKQFDESLTINDEVLNESMVFEKPSDYPDNQTDADFEGKRRKIVEFNKAEIVYSQKEDVIDENQQERKFKLSNIKGLKSVQSLFDYDPLEKIKEEKTDSGSLLKANVSTDFMEEERQKPLFRLDLNDKVAFTKFLFNGDEEKLNFTVDKLNSFKTLDSAKVYLSEIYYENNWEKLDDYAQRLWNLVENKFL